MGVSFNNEYTYLSTTGDSDDIQPLLMEMITRRVNQDFGSILYTSPNPSFALVMVAIFAPSDWYEKVDYNGLR
jgi:hypothetical protein